MAKSEARERALKLFLEHSGRIGNKRIGELVDAPEKTVSAWKIRDEWKRQLDCKLRGEEFRHDDALNQQAKKGKHHQNHKHGVYSSISYLTLSDEERNLLTALDLDSDPLFPIKEDILAISVRLKRITDHIEEIRPSIYPKDKELLHRLESEATQLLRTRQKHVEMLIKANEQSEEKDVQDLSWLYRMLEGETPNENN